MTQQTSRYAGLGLLLRMCAGRRQRINHTSICVATARTASILSAALLRVVRGLVLDQRLGDETDNHHDTDSGGCVRRLDERDGADRGGGRRESEPAGRAGYFFVEGSRHLP